MSEIAQAERRHSQLPVALGIATGIALLMTVMSVAIYYFAGFYKLDLSRPGFEAERGDIENTVEPVFDTTGPLTIEVLDQVLQDFDARVEGLRSYGNFRDQTLSDAELLISE